MNFPQTLRICTESKVHVAVVTNGFAANCAALVGPVRSVWIMRAWKPSGLKIL
ncbi:pyruvate-formate lyase-activating enzyme [Comamonas sp. 4034]